MTPLRKPVSWTAIRPQGALLALLGMLTLAVVALIAVAVFGATKYQWAQERLASLEPRYARLLGLEKGAGQLTQALAAAQTQLAQCCYAEDKDATQAGNDAQQRLRGIFTSAGMQIISSQVMPPKDEDGFDRIPIAMRLEGELIGLQSALIGLQRQSPELWVDSLAIQTIGAVLPTQPQRLGVQLTISVLRRRT